MPRGIAIDPRGNLLVIQRGRGLTGHTLDANGCVTSTKTIISNTQINHGIDLTPDGRRIIASSADAAWSWDYDPATMTATNQRLLVTGMNNPYHFTRTVLISQKNPNIFALNVGSNGNIDAPTRDAGAGRAQIRVFDYNTLPSNSVSYTSSYGKVLGYGLRNDVGVTQDRAGNFYSIENSLDDARRLGRDIHNNNPAEKVYFLGDPANPRGIFGGYPECYTVWEPRDFTDSTKRAGDWFTQNNSGQYNDAWCETNAVKPIVILPPHMAPLDFKFGLGNDTNMYVGFHGSWNRTPPQGYRVVVVPGTFDAGGVWRPTANSLEATKEAWSNILTNSNEGSCSGFTNANCFRPVGLVFSASGENLYVSSDTSGEVFLLKRPGGPSVNPNPPPISTVIPTPTTTSQPPITTTSGNPPGPTQSLYGQCGGTGWSGPTLCPAGAVCRAANQFYSQCVPS
ncbi:hypothetical protein FA15DRAFT_753613 [Coprinopsis marcescibilis]|uniref:CBM1 domain-containing protein n=1 Tax=Coprinopsis marcescibilis TaxID=230819 RepID=A0A5C3L6K8_COPMA|nr:hypothetical protein FA15DRAFT_753613 [Coprinopsis marcescibilis]